MTDYPPMVRELMQGPGGKDGDGELSNVLPVSKEGLP